MTAREARLNRIRAGLPAGPPAAVHHPAASQRQRDAAIRIGASSAGHAAGPPKREISDKAAQLIALALKDLLRS
jgi:hypothetical protein